MITWAHANYIKACGIFKKKPTLFHASSMYEIKLMSQQCEDFEMTSICFFGGMTQNYHLSYVHLILIFVSEKALILFLKFSN